MNNEELNNRAPTTEPVPPSYPGQAIQPQQANPPAPQPSQPPISAAASTLSPSPPAQPTPLPVNPAPGPSKKKIIILITVITILLLSGAAGAYFLTRKDEKPKTQQTSEPASTEREESTGTDSIIEVKGRDADRKSSINAIHARVEIYFAENAKYPSLAQLNDPAFRAANFVGGMKDNDLIDPKGSKPMLAATPAAGVYAYSAIPTGCDNVTVDCTGMTLTATLEQGGTYVKTGSNNDFPSL